MSIRNQRRQYVEVLASGTRVDVTQFERDLIQGVVSGDEEVFRLVADVHVDRLYRVAHRIVRNDDDASDVVQEVLLTLFLKGESFRADSQLSTWLHRVTCNAALMLVRRRRRHERVQVDDLKISHKDPSQVYEQREALAQLQTAWKKLKPDHRDILNLRVREEMSLKEIADSLELTLAATKSRIHRARLELSSVTS